jgi:hypothetical protein
LFGLEDPFVSAVVAFLAMLFVGFMVVRLTIYRQEEWVARCLALAERDFNNLVSSGLAHGGRRERVEERRRWNQMDRPPVVQVNTAGYRSVAHDVVEWNEKELSGKGSTMGKATITAFLLRELYDGDVEGAQIKIFADTRNNNGTPPYIAPGIYELVGFSQFDPEHGFPPNVGVERWLLQRVVRRYGFPREIRMINAATNTYRDPFDALAQLIQQNI